MPKDTKLHNEGEFTLELWRKEQAQAKQKEHYDRTVKDARSFEVGSLVKIKKIKKTPGACSAFEKKCVGPFKVFKEIQ